MDFGAVGSVGGNLLAPTSGHQAVSNFRKFKSILGQQGIKLGVRKSGLNSVGNHGSGSKSSRSNKLVEGKLGPRLLDSSNHSIIVIKENQNSNVSKVSTGKDFNNLGFKNLISYKSLPVKERMTSGAMVFKGNSETIKPMMDASVTVEDVINGLVQILDDECLFLGDQMLLSQQLNDDRTELATNLHAALLDNTLGNTNEEGMDATFE